MRKTTILIALMFLATLSGCSNESTKYVPLKADEEITIIVSTDMHFLASDYHDDKASSQQLYRLRDGKLTKYGTEILHAFIDEVITKKPTALVLTGDLTFNGEMASHKEIAEALKEVKKAGIQVFISPGNHDIRNPFAYSFNGDDVFQEKTVEADEFQKIYQDFGWNQAIMQDEKSLSYLVELREGLWLLMMDANKYMYNSGFGTVAIGTFQTETIEWMKECFELAKEKGAKIITSTHQSLLINEYLHSDDYRITNSNALKNLMAQYGSKVNLSGHIHTQAIVSNEYQDATLYEVVTESLAVAQNNYGFITITPDDVFTYETVSLDVESWAKKKGLTDYNLLNFSEYGIKFYQDVSYTNFHNRYEGYGMTPQDAEILAKFVADLNPYYFSGRIEEFREEALNSPAYKLALKYDGEYNMNYIISMLRQRKLDQRKLSIQL